MSIISPLIAILGIVGSTYYIFTFPAPGFSGYFDKASLVFLGIMPPSIILLSHTLKDFALGVKTLLQSLFKNHSTYQNEIIEILTKSSAMVRAEGIGSLVNIRNGIRYQFLKEAISLIINDFSPDEIRHNLTNKLNAKQSRMALSANLFENMSKVSPGVGMIGTLIGLIAMMADMKDPSKIGAGMALAMITTLYGLLLGTIFYAPCSEKIALEAEKALEIDMLVMEGVMSLKGKKSSIHMKDIMRTYGGQKQDQQKQKGGRGRA